MDSIRKSLNLSDRNPGAAGKEIIVNSSAKLLNSYSPIDGALLGAVEVADESAYERVINEAHETFKEWRLVPAPKRGEVVREIGNLLREHKKDLGRLVTLEMGKILSEGEGEIQEAIDIADFAVGLSRQLYGKTMHSERPAHRMYEQWHPLGPVGVITAFNFPAAVWAWNAMIAAVCGDVVIWKPSEETPLTAVALNTLCRSVAEKHGFPGLFSLLVGDGPELGKKMAADRRLPLISATGSCRMGRSVGETVAARLGRSILELGGNNAIIVLKDADFDLLIPSVLFGAVGTAGQRCTTTRRILIEKEVKDEFLRRLLSAYKQIRIGDPLKSETLMGPLINERAVEIYKNALVSIKEQGGEILCGGRVLEGMPSGLYVEPTVVAARHEMPIVKEETFAPILYVIEVSSLDQALEYHNDVPQGLSSAIFTRDLRSAERFLSAAGSDCGIANVNIGTSGAEIGGAFGGEKDTGGGRESGSDAWKQYMRRQTNTINYSTELPLAQGIKFEL
ncbi:MAG: aldehyde dehydrogenase family protein [Candidatus Dadabacteria bacterium]|nr:MAG: aldehyde dehydrogenase family protein [Candidatus Dadabacteria bacterium]